MYACKYLHTYRCYLQFIHIGTRSIFGNIQCTVGSVRYEMPFGNHQRCTVAWCRFFILKEVFLQTQAFGQTIATSHHLTPNGGLEREVPLFQGNLGLVKYDNLARTMQQLLCLFLQMSSYLWHLFRNATASFFPGKLLSWKIWSLSSGDPAPKNMFFVGLRRW